MSTLRGEMDRLHKILTSLTNLSEKKNQTDKCILRILPNYIFFQMVTYLKRVTSNTKSQAMVIPSSH